MAVKKENLLLAYLNIAVDVNYAHRSARLMVSRLSIGVQVW
jgi:hypothetical protein